MTNENRSVHSRSPEFHALREFLRGYLHQDAAVEYGSARNAANAFLDDADAGQVDELRAEWARFLTLHKTVESVNKEIQKLGAAWRFETFEELREMLSVFNE